MWYNITVYSITVNNNIVYDKEMVEKKTKKHIKQLQCIYNNYNVFTTFLFHHYAYHDQQLELMLMYPIVLIYP